MGTFNRFQESPFDPLADHMAKARECVGLVEPMFDSVFEQRFEELTALTLQVAKVEHEADRIKTEIRHHMPATFALPIRRGDLLTYLSLQDNLADSVEKLARNLTIKHLTLPPRLLKGVRELVRRVLKVCALVFQCTDQLTDLKESDFGTSRTDRIIEMVGQAEHAEWEADKAQYMLARELFAAEDELKDTEILLWSNVFQELGQLANHADKTADCLRRMLVS